MKKMILGMMLYISGFLGAVAMILVATPFNITHIGAGIFAPFIVFCILGIAGLIICFRDAYSRK